MTGERKPVDTETRNEKPSKIVMKAFLKTLPVFAAYEIVGMGFGILMSHNGYGPLWTFACSLFIYAGSMQYVAVDLLAGGASVLTSALMTLMVNARHLFYGISMVGKYRNMGKFRPYLIFGLTDETYSLLCDDADISAENAGLYCFLVSLFDQSYWVSGSVIGALMAGALPFNSEGIDFSMTALFITVFTEQWLTNKDHRPALSGLLASILCHVLFGESSFLIPAMLFITVLLSVPYAAARKAQPADEDRPGKEAVMNKEEGPEYE